MQSTTAIKKNRMASPVQLRRACKVGCLVSKLEEAEYCTGLTVADAASCKSQRRRLAASAPGGHKKDFDLPVSRLADGQFIFSGRRVGDSLFEAYVSRTSSATAAINLVVVSTAFAQRVRWRKNVLNSISDRIGSRLIPARSESK